VIATTFLPPLHFVSSDDWSILSLFSIFFRWIQPMAVLGAIVITGVLHSFEFGHFYFLWKVHKLDCLTWCVSFLITMFVSVLYGVLSAVLLSLPIIQYESAYPHTSVLGRLPNSTVYRDVKQYSEATQYPGIVLVRIDAPLYFANAQYIREVSRFPICLSDVYPISCFPSTSNLFFHTSFLLQM